MRILTKPALSDSSKISSNTDNGNQKSEELRMGISDKDEAAPVPEGSTTKTDKECRSARDPPLFQFGEVVSIRDATYNKIYDAKVLACHYERERCFVHYVGWTNRYDRWVETNCLIKKELGFDNNTMLRDISTSELNTFVGRGKKRKKDSFIKEKAHVPLAEVVRLQIPLLLRRLLLNDYDLIHRLWQFVTLPRYPTVDVILKKYLDYRSQKSGNTSKSAEEIICGLRSYFDKALEMILLYKYEREQLANALGKEPPSKVYGVEHLLRMFVKLPELLTRANIEEETSKELLEVVNDLLMFLQETWEDYYRPKCRVLADAETSTNK